MENRPGLKDLLSEIPDEELNNLKLEYYKAGETIIKKGAVPENIYILISGLINSLIDTKNGILFNSYRIKPVDVFGISEIISDKDQVYLANIAAQVDSLVAVLNKDVFLRWLHTYNKFCVKTMFLVTDRLHGAIDTYVNMSNMPIYYKTIYYLTYSYDCYVQANGHGTENDSVKLPETRAEIAEKLGTNIRSVNRSIQQLKDEDLISINRGKIIIDSSHIEKLKESLHLYQM